MIDQVKLDDGVKRNMAALLKAVEKPIQKSLKNMTTAEIKHALENYSEYLKLDIRHYLNTELQSRDVGVNDFDTMFNNVTGDQ